MLQPPRQPSNAPWLRSRAARPPMRLRARVGCSALRSLDAAVFLAALCACMYVCVGLTGPATQTDSTACFPAGVGSARLRRCRCRHRCRGATIGYDCVSQAPTPPGATGSRCTDPAPVRLTGGDVTPRPLMSACHAQRACRRSCRAGSDSALDEKLEQSSDQIVLKALGNGDRGRRACGADGGLADFPDHTAQAAHYLSLCCRSAQVNSRHTTWRRCMPTEHLGRQQRFAASKMGFIGRERGPLGRRGALARNRQISPCARECCPPCEAWGQKAWYAF
eukprot:360685-Chlamydomonas_euryale.AAC.8